METMDNIVPLLKVPSMQEAEKIIRDLAKLGKISWSRHCLQRMKERDITTPQVINCLLKGRVSEPPFRSIENGGGYNVSMERGTAGEWLRVIVSMKYNQTLLVVTAINYYY